VSRVEKQLRRLVSMEADFVRRLEAELEGVARGENTSFFETPELNPHDFPPHAFSKVAMDLSEVAAETLRLRELLGMPAEDSPAALLHDAQRRSADLGDPHRLGPIRMAKELLKKLRSLGSP
jgi:hypothetical protein